jgi:hypothetical protein
MSLATPAVTSLTLSFKPGSIILLSLQDVPSVTECVHLRHLEIDTGMHDGHAWRSVLLALIHASFRLETVLAPNSLVFEAIPHLAACQSLRVAQTYNVASLNTSEVRVGPGAFPVLQEMRYLPADAPHASLASSFLIHGPVHHLRELSLCGDPGVFSDIWMGLLNRLAGYTQLEYLELVIEPRDLPLNAWQTALETLENLSSLDMLRLHVNFDLAIPEDAFIHATARWHVLRRIDVYSQSQIMEDGPHISLRAFIAMLSHCPRLEYTTLSISCASFPPEGLVAQVEKTAHMPVDGISFRDVTNPERVARILYRVFPRLEYPRASRNLDCDEQVEAVHRALAFLRSSGLVPVTESVCRLGML